MKGRGRTNLRVGPAVSRDWVEIGPMDKLWAWLLERLGVEPGRVMDGPVDAH